MRNFFIFCLLCLLVSCKSTKQLTDKSTVSETVQTTERVTTTNTQEELVADRTVSTQENSLSVDNTIITFNADGGTYNATTGESTNVISVKKDSKNQTFKKELEQAAMQLRTDSATIQQLNDSIRVLNQQNNIAATQSVEAKNNWYWWLVIGIIIGVAAIIFLKKFPYTKPLFFWL